MDRKWKDSLADAGACFLRVALLAGAVPLAIGCHRDAMPDAADQAITDSAPPAAVDPPLPSNAHAGETPPAEARRLVLAAGQSQALDAGTTLRFERVVNDSRCPENAQCVWAGDVRIALSLQSGDQRAEFQMAMAMDNSAARDGFRVDFLDYGGCPEDANTAAGRECATLDVRPEPAAIETPVETPGPSTASAGDPVPARP